MQFSKYHGHGNDFVLADLSEDAAPSPALLDKLCQRHRGVGADGLILVGPLTDEGARMVIYNRDGSRPEMCGNGVRCVVAMMADAGLLALGERVVILSDAGPRPCVLESGHEGRWQVAVDMGPASISPRREAIAIEGVTLDWLDVDMGNPHAVTFARPELEVIDAIGARLNGGHPLFPRGVNVEFVVPDESGAMDVVVYERGVGRTLACGTGACAVAAAAWEEGRAPKGAPLVVKLPGGPLTIEEREGHVWMTGPAEHVFTGMLAHTSQGVASE